MSGRQRDPVGAAAALRVLWGRSPRALAFEASCTGPGTVYMQAIADIENELVDLAGVVDEVLHREGDDLDAQLTDQKLTRVRDQLRELAESFGGNR